MIGLGGLAPGIRQHIMLGAYNRAKPFASCPENKTKREKKDPVIPFEGTLPKDLPSGPTS